MHPMFVKLFMEDDADDSLAEQERRRRLSTRGRRIRVHQAARVTVRDRDRRPVR